MFIYLEFCNILLAELDFLKDREIFEFNRKHAISYGQA